MSRILPDLTSPAYESLTIHNPIKPRVFRRRMKPRKPLARNDLSLWQFGNFKGKSLKDVPTDYLKWVLTTNGVKTITDDVKTTAIVELSNRPDAIEWLRKNIKKIA